MDKEEIILTESEGAIVIREGAIPEIYAPISVSDECDDIRFTLAFLLYAVEQEEWVEQFSTFVDSVKDSYSDLDVASRRAAFEVIDGDKE